MIFRLAWIFFRRRARFIFSTASRLKFGYSQVYANGWMARRECSLWKPVPVITEWLWERTINQTLKVAACSSSGGGSGRCHGELPLISAQDEPAAATFTTLPTSVSGRCRGTQTCISSVSWPLFSWLYSVLPQPNSSPFSTHTHTHTALQ